VNFVSSSESDIPFNRVASLAMSIPPRDFREFSRRTGLIISAQFYRSEVDKEEMTAGGDEDDFCAKQIR